MSLSALAFAVLIAAAGASCYRFASRLFPGSALEAFACSFLLLPALLVLPILISGLAGRFEPFTASLLLALLTLALLAVRVSPVGNTRDTHPRGQPSLASTISSLVVVAGICAAGWPLLTLVLDEARSGTFKDVVSFEIPTVLNFLRDQTLWTFDGYFSFYPQNYGLLMAWGIMTTRSFALIAVIQLLVFIGVGAYSCLLLRCLLDRAEAKATLLPYLFLILGLLTLSLNRDTVALVGKGDLFIGLCTLAAITYLLRYWQASARESSETLLILGGVAAGLMVGTKLSAAYLVAWLAVLHLGLIGLRHGCRLQPWLRTSLRHALLIAPPGLILAGPWLLRLTRYQFTRADAQFSEMGLNKTVARLFGVPVLQQTTDTWLGLAGLMMIGAVLFLLPYRKHRHLLKLAGFSLLFLPLLSLLLSSEFKRTGLGPGVLGALGFAVILAGRWLVKPRVDQSTALLALFGLGSLLLFTFIPFSAFMRGKDYDNPLNVFVQYRFIYSVFPILLVAMIAIGYRLWHAMTPRWQSWSYPLPAPGRRHVIAGLTFLFCLIAPASWRAATYESLDSLSRFDGSRQASEPTSVYSWVRSNLEQASILVIDPLPPYGFYGRHLSNRVFQMPHGYQELGKWQGWDLDGMRPFIDQRRIEYLAFPLRFRRQSLPAATEPELAATRDAYRVVFEDSGAVIFATEYASAQPVLERLDYDFSTLAAHGVLARGWHPPITLRDGTVVRIPAVDEPKLILSIGPASDLRITARVVGLRGPFDFAGIECRVGSSLLPSSLRLDGNAAVFSATVPPEALTRPLVLTFRHPQFSLAAQPPRVGLDRVSLEPSP
ncbi:MAG: hypothetical protein AAF560_06105 [Acidobacteriota bacterium]